MTTHRVGQVRTIKVGLVIVMVCLVLSGPLSDAAQAHGNLPPHIVSGMCTGSDIWAVEQDIRADYRAGQVYGYNLYYEQFVRFQLVAAWKDAAGVWQYSSGKWVAGRNGIFAPGYGYVLDPKTGSWDPVTNGYGHGASSPGTTIGTSAISIASIPGDGSYFVGVNIYWYPLNLVNSANQVQSQVQGAYSHWSGWTTVACRSGMGAYGGLFSDTDFVLE